MSTIRPIVDDYEALHPTLTRPPSAYQRSLTPSLHTANDDNSSHETKEKYEQLVPISPMRTEAEREVWPLNGHSSMESARLVEDRKNKSDEQVDEIQPFARRRSSFYTAEPVATRPVFRPGHSSLDLYAESPPGTPFTSPHPSWLSHGQPYQHLSYASSNTPTPLSSEINKPLFPASPSQIFDKDWVKEGLIAKVHSRDDVGQLSNWKRYLYFSAPILAILTLGLYWLYFTLRILFVLSAQRQQHRWFPLAWVFIVVEISVAIPIFLQSFFTIFSLKKRKRPKLRLVGKDVPTVDVFITCCGEEVDLILDTVRASCDVDYPLNKFRVVVLDDAKSAELQRSVQGLTEIYPNLHYRARTKIPGVPHHFKAGNLNYGLEEVIDMPGGASQYVAALDADMIPEQSWLRAIVPHLLADPKVALACPPQLFYNVPPGDPLCQSLDFFVHVSEPIKDALGVAWCTGSGYVLRRDALEEIGLFPKGSLAEDVATSTLMLGKGWKTAYIHEPLQFGTVPDSYGSHLKQRTRWAIGTVDTSFKLKFCLYGDAVRQMTFYQRMSSFIYAVLSLFNVFLTLSLFALPIVLITGNALVAYANDEQLRWLIRSCFAAFIMNRICEVVLFIPSGYATGQRGSRAQLWMSPYIALTIVRSFVLPRWLGGQTQAFKPSGSLKSELNERDPAARAPLFRRLRIIVLNYLAGYHVLYVYFCLTAVTLTSLHCLLDKPTTRDQLECLLTHAFWPPVAWVMTCSAFWIPVTYAIDPPSMPDREALLDRDSKTGIAHPTRHAKKTAFKPQTALFEVEYCITTAFTALVFAAAFFF
ncbi:hypothetical protein NA57DRAFT_70364 [Rhizodiscina lignyota]|uniref:Glycosyltransferase 2-like domain-containing protein n=1 Tax=Rhizodiscina lignyota TaxID=1504668 RepID=A0A9P4IMA2_9PEZI|nr:hypothetical protein NA57DRAFT_70364 [Rhizodiscina lignyota]